MPNMSIPWNTASIAITLNQDGDKGLNNPPYPEEKEEEYSSRRIRVFQTTCKGTEKHIDIRKSSKKGVDAKSAYTGM